MSNVSHKESTEDYLETILMLKARMGCVRAIDIVNEMSYTKPSVSIAMRKLREAGCIEVDKDGCIELTSRGLAKAEMILERHRTLAQILVQIGVPEEIAKDDACRIEHVIHAETFEKIKEHIVPLLMDKTPKKE